jgi:hypothetical protein
VAFSFRDLNIVHDEYYFSALYTGRRNNEFSIQQTCHSGTKNIISSGQYVCLFHYAFTRQLITVILRRKETNNEKRDMEFHYDQ